MTLSLGRCDVHLLDLFAFLRQHADVFSVARYYDDGHTEDALPLAQQPQEIQRILRETRAELLMNRDRYRRMLGFDTELELKNYLNALMDHDFDHTVDEYSPPNTRRVFKAPATPEDERNQSFRTTTADYLGKWYTNIAPATIGPLFEVCYFRMGAMFDEVTKQMTPLYNRELIIDGVTFEDPAFYHNGRCIFSVCSHEHFDRLMLNDAEFSEFVRCGIPFEELR